MYGTIMRAKIKAGRKDEYQRLLEQEIPSAEAYGNGLHSVEMAWEDKDPDRVVVIVHFRDRESYVANADRAETNSEYQKQAEFFDGQPEWTDINYVKYVGKPVGQESGAAAV